MGMLEAPPAIAGVDGPDRQPRDIQTLLEELDAALWADGVLGPDEQRLIAAFFYNQKQKIAAMMQQQEQGAGGPEQFTPAAQGMQGEEEPLTAGAPGAGGDSDFEDYQP